MTIHLDPATVLIAATSSAISILATWYFSKRHYSIAPRPQPVTENDIKLRDNDNTFRFLVTIVVAFLILVAILVFGCDPEYLRNQQAVPEPTSGSQQELLASGLNH